MRRVGITGVGGAAGVCCIKALRMSGESYYIIGMDASPLSAGLYLTDKARVIPYATEHTFISELLKTAKKDRIDVLIPTVDEELLPLALATKEFEKLGSVVAVSKPSAIKASNDKWLTYEKLSKAEIPTPKAWLSPISPRELQEIRTPVIVKPRIGRGARNTYLCTNKAELKFAIRKVKHSIIQEHLPGTEHTTDTFSDLKGKAMIAVPRRRIETKFGVTWRGMTEHNPKVEEICKNAAEAMGIIGPACIQTKMSEDGASRIFEVNPRIGGTTILSVSAGVNIPHLTVKLFLHEKLVVPKKFKQKAICRYLEDVFIKP